MRTRLFHIDWVSKEKKNVIIKGVVSEELRNDFKAACAKEGRSMNEVLTTLAHEYVTKVLKSQGSKRPEKQPQSLAELVQKHFFVLHKANIKNIMAIAEGGHATHADVIRISSVLDIDSEYVQQLANKVKEEEKSWNSSSTDRPRTISFFLVSISIAVSLDINKYYFLT